jgi:glyoxylase-like metal-dependent hydrolase (beta-lactamase superfamily II)
VGTVIAMVREIDTMHLGRDRVIAAHEVREELIVDPGAASTVDTLVAELSGEPRAILLTHIHLDHASATGALVRRWPDLRVYVSEVGAPHIVEPKKLLASAGRLYGPENMQRLWGEVLPVPAANVVALEGGEEVEGFRVEPVPGHASHHLAWLDLEEGDAYVGDTAGVRIPPGDFTVAPTPPPEIDVEAWLDSLDRVEAMDPQRLRLTHFGVAEDVWAQLERTRDSLRFQSEVAAGGDRDRFLRELDARIDGGTDAETAHSLRQASPPDQLWQGLERYWRKRREREAA